MGSEGKGMRRLTLELCDDVFSIPMMGQVESLNVSVASGICLYEINRQKNLIFAKEYIKRAQMLEPLYLAPQPGLEPGTHGLTVHCSTN